MSEISSTYRQTKQPDPAPDGPVVENQVVENQVLVGPASSSLLRDVPAWANPAWASPGNPVIDPATVPAWASPDDPATDL
ncbi:MAG: hypothetical protein U9N87_11790 [Planctomycetota bacterium]|nr:hypothetical protein [Planctomycetota bacterium]